ncbi:MAG: nickel pincer cofactor biosynthesis protein LarC [Nitrospinae bacterium]|nr:nickel pincer cofactor biosynthesis protein LarC [Nitrospinota bacterium]
MTKVYLDCFSGISGDMVVGALLDAGLPLELLKERLASLPVEGYEISSARVKRCGVSAIKFGVDVDMSRQKGHRHYKDIVKLIESAQLALEVKETALRIFDIVAVAEGEVHGVDKEKVHFHEVGAVDSIVDIVGAAVGFHELGVTGVVCSAINTGSGMVMTEHGLLPVPAPATALILRGVPTYAEGPEKELTTPTGAAIAKALSANFGNRPLMTVGKVANGAGGHDFADRPNVLRMLFGESESSGYIHETLVEIETTIDDMNPQQYPVVMEKLFEAGALDVTYTPVFMKKGRPGVVFTALCPTALAGDVEKVFFVHTTTLGLRKRPVERVSLERNIVEADTPYGPVKVKIAYLPDGGRKIAPEYESVKEVAERSGAPFAEVYEAARSAKLD